ncbi:MAG: rod shape-determining protein MreC [Thermodesulfobacteriota bacterium]|nr:MAG: rod shape-determining protein MreC [Thermodesulfobacteriota bacterium]
MNSFAKRHRIIIIAMLLALFSLHLALTDTKVAERGFVLKRVFSITVNPVQNAITVMYRGAAGAVNNYVSLVGVQKENESYRDALIKLQEENYRLKEEVNLSGRLKRLLGYKQSVPFETTSAAILAYNMDRLTKTAVINKGSADGMRKDMSVITPEGVVGRTIRVTGRTSTVLLNTDPRSNIEAIVMRTRVRGIVEGNGSDGLILKYVRELDDVKAGDLVVTSGFSGLFPKGLVIGEVTEIRKGTDNFFNHITVTPRVDLKRLEDVLVVKNAGLPTGLEAGARD